MTKSKATNMRDDAPIAVRAFTQWTPKTRQWRSPVRQSEKNFFLSVTYLTLLDRFLNDAAEDRQIGALIWRTPD
jgi:hypothetical protein